MNQRRRYLQQILISAVLSAVLMPRPALAQGSISGVVTDQQGAVVPGATISASGGGVRREARSNPDGTFTLPMPPGRYELRVESRGFATHVRTLDVSAEQSSRVTITLSVAGLADAVTVVGVGAIPTRNTTATKTDTPLIETPQSVSIITSEQIDSQAAQTMEEVVRYSPGVRAEMYGPDNRGDWFTLRGGSEGSTVLDGLRLPLSGWWGNVRNEPFAFDQVVVLRGPSSVMFGQAGPGGVLNLVSKLPAAGTRREIGVQFGNHQHKQAAFDFNGQANARGNVQYRMVALLQHSGTQVDHADEERQYFAPSLAWQPTRATNVTFYGQYQRDESKNTVGFFPTVGTRLPAPNGPIPDDTFIGEPEWDSYGGDRVRLGYRLEHRLNPSWTLRNSFRHDDVDGHVLGMYANFWEGGFLEDGRSLNRTWYATRTDTRIDNLEALAQGTFRIGNTQHTLLIGVDGLWSSDRNDSAGDFPATPLDVYAPVYGTFPEPDLEFSIPNPTKVQQVGVLAQDQIKIDSRWVVMAGIRHDSASTDVTGAPESSSDDAAWSRRVGLVYLANGGWAPYASYADSFEATIGTDFYGAPYKPKRGEQIEAGVKWAPENSGHFVSAAVYDLTEKNRLTADPDNPLNSIQAGEVAVKGVELEAVVSSRRWDLQSNYTFTDAAITESSIPDDPYLGKQLFSIPRHSAAVWAVHKFLLRTLGARAGLGVRYVGETWDGIDNLSTPSTTLVDALFSVERDHWRLAVNASNLLDKTYIATCLERGDCWYGNRRKMFASVTIRP